MEAPSFQDIDSEEFSDCEEQEAVLLAAEAAFSEEEVEYMLHILTERGLFKFIQLFVEEKRIPVEKLLLPFGVSLPTGMVNPQEQIRLLKIACLRVLRNRAKLPQYNTPADAVTLIRNAKKILILTGAGVSTSCGIPDFRSATGLYARLKEENWDLDDPQQMFDLDFFKQRPDIFYSFAKEIYPSNFVPSPCHRFIRLLELNGQLLRNYTQNIDGLFEQVGVENMFNCHGSFATASCLKCHVQFPGSAIEADVFAQRVPLCPHCPTSPTPSPPPLKPIPSNWKDDASEDEEEIPRGKWEGKAVVKPDIIFFGEMLSGEFDRLLLADREEVDLVITIGTSLRVSPVAQLPSHLPHSIPQILINLDPISHVQFDIQLLGDGDTIIRYLTAQLGPSYDLEKKVPVVPIPPHALSELIPEGFELEEGGKAEGEVLGRLERELKVGAEEELGKRMEGEDEVIVPERVGNSHAWLFPGFVDRENRWLKAVRKAYSDETDSEGESPPTNPVVEGVEQTEEVNGREEVRVEGGERSRKWEEDIVVESKRAKLD